jgi:hypothetical protein
MSQKVKIQTGFSEKTSENYNSQQYSVALEMECQINGSTREIEEASGKLFALCRKIVSAQKGVNVDTLLNSESSGATKALSRPASAPEAPVVPPVSPSTSNGNGATRDATPKQIRYILELAKKVGMSKADIHNLKASYNKKTFESLSSVEASKIIDFLSKKQAA